MEKKNSLAATPVSVADSPTALPKPSQTPTSIVLTPISIQKMPIEEEEEIIEMFKAKKKNKSKKVLLSSLGGGGPEDEAPASTLSFGIEAEDKEIVEEPYEDLLSVSNVY